MTPFEALQEVASNLGGMPDGLTFELFARIEKAHEAIGQLKVDARDDLLIGLRGNIASVQWELDYESDDSGGAIEMVSSVELVLNDATATKLAIGDADRTDDENDFLSDLMDSDSPEGIETLRRLEEGEDRWEVFHDCLGAKTGIARESISDFIQLLHEKVWSIRHCSGWNFTPDRNPH